MKQVVQAVSGGPVRVVEVPRPTISATEVLVRTAASVVSAGTEGATTALARSSLLAKARARPDLVREVIKKSKTEGVVNAARAVRSRLSTDIPLGYSAAGRVVEVGETVVDLRPGMLVATAGGGKANHAEFQAVPGLLCAPVPDGVPVGDAAFATLGAIALHGLRLSDATVGSRVVFIGLGLLGQLGTRIAAASGMHVAGIDLADAQIERTRAAGITAFKEDGEQTTKVILQWANGVGADAVVITASDRTSRIIERVPELCRDRATVVVVGDIGLDIARTPFYEKELQLRFGRSYGPGRYDPTYESMGIDYPAGYVRWTEGRNLAAILDLLASGRLRVDDLVTHRFPIGEAASAYTMIESRSEPFLAVQFTYDSEPAVGPEPIRLRPTAQGELGVGLLGAGTFARKVLVPALHEAGFGRLVSVASASGMSARSIGERAGFEKLASGADEVVNDPDVSVVVVCTPHDSHASLTAQALHAGKHVFCEKPLALTMEELEDVETAWRASKGVLFVGFNRRWSEAIHIARDMLAERSTPVTITYRVNSRPVSRDHWYNDRRQGGRLIGEVCHFIDTCNNLVGGWVTAAAATAGGEGELLMSEHLAVNLGYSDGSVAAITYTTGGHASTEKERIEILGGGRSITIVDFREVTIDGKALRLTRRDKGHGAELAAFRNALRDGATRDTSTMVDSMRITLEAAHSLRIDRTS